jgi:N utilization substance protein B
VTSPDPKKTSAPEGEKPARGSLAKRRRNARQKAMQALYQWDFDPASASIENIVQQFCDLQNMDRVDTDFFRELVTHVTANLSDIDNSIVSFADRELAELDPVERAVLRVTCAELRCRPDIPYRVVVNEAVEVARVFGAEDGYKFVNGVADKLAAELRAVEYRHSDKQE